MSETNVSSESYQINVNEFAYALVTSDTGSSYTVGEKKKIPGVREITFTPTYATGKVYGDGIIKKNESRLTGATIKVSLNKVPIEDRAILSGNEYTNGVMHAVANATQPKAAFYYEMPSTEGNKEQIWFFVGQAQPFGKTAKQTEDNISYGSDEITIECTARKKDNRIYDLADTANADLTAVNSTTFATAPDATLTNNSEA